MFAQKNQDDCLVKVGCGFHFCALPFMVRLITHNLLACHVKGCTSNNFPLEFKDVQVVLRESEFNPDFLRGFIPKLEWSALAGAAREV
jgi:multifunctional methyltransferase subunit TRM112